MVRPIKDNKPVMIRLDGLHATNKAVTSAYVSY